VTTESDLDLIIRAREPIPRKAAELLLKAFSHQEAAVEVRIETPFGSVALPEHVPPSSGRVLMKTCDGPRLVMDPWNPEQGASR
jgi:phosphoribosyl-dephospho-CoA transferase